MHRRESVPEDAAYPKGTAPLPYPTGLTEGLRRGLAVT